MAPGQIYTYEAAMGMCLVLTAVLLLCNHKNWKSEQWRPLLGIYILLMLSVAADMIWVTIDGRPDRITLNYVLNTVEFSSFGLIGYFWYCYCCTYGDSPLLRKKWVRLLSALPVIVITVLILTTRLTGLVFYVDEQGVYRRGRYFIVQQLGYLYLVGATVISIQNWKKSKVFSRKRQMLMMVTFIISPLALGGLQLLFPPMSFPSMQFSIVVSMLLMYADEQERKITHDELTKLINRFEFERLLEESILHYRRNNLTTLYVLMGDMDQFKTINDTLGHRQGDRVLKAVGHVLHSVSREYEAVAARISGDEFCLIMDAESDETVEALIGEVSRQVEEVGAGWKIPMSMSIGYVHYDGKMLLPELLEQADMAMYRKKNTRQPVR